MIKWLKQESKETGIDVSGILLLIIVTVGTMLGLLLFVYGILKQYLGI